MGKALLGLKGGITKNNRHFTGRKGSSVLIISMCHSWRISFVSKAVTPTRLQRFLGLAMDLHDFADKLIEHCNPTQSTKTNHTETDSGSALFFPSFSPINAQPLQNYHSHSPPPNDVSQEEFNLRNDIMNDA